MINKFKLLYTLMLVLCSDEKTGHFDKNITSPLKNNYDNEIKKYNANPSLDKRIKVLQYRTNTIYDLSLVAKFKTKIIFDKEEEVENITFGEGQGVDVIYNNKTEEIILQPLCVGIDTNLIITTNLREYIFSLKSYENSLANEDKLIYILSFQYPMSEKVKVRYE